MKQPKKDHLGPIYFAVVAKRPYWIVNKKVIKKRKT